MPSQSEIVQSMLSAMQLAEPDLDTSIGSIPRRLFDVVAESIAEAYNDRFLMSYIYDVDSKVGADLEEFCARFGIERFPARRATGTITFARNTPSTSNYFIPSQSQVATPGGIVVATVVPATLSAGDLSIDVPAMAVRAGSQGNIAAHSLSQQLSPLTGVVSFDNAAAFTGGTDAESDDELRLRFKRTLFRNLSGTEQMFLGVALEDSDTIMANVIGVAKTRREQIAISSGTGASTVQDAAYIIPDTVFFGTDLDTGSIFKREVHYTFNEGVIPPTVTRLDATVVPDGIYDLSFKYVPLASRNNVASGVTNRVDIYVFGERIVTATETLIFDRAKQFNNTVGSPYRRTNFARIDETTPVLNNYLVPFSFSPVADPSTIDQIIINGVTYLEGTHFWLVNDITSAGMGPRSLSGIEFNQGALALPATGQAFTVTYAYNSLPRDIELRLEQWRLVSIDTWVHQAITRRLNLYMAVILQRGFTLSSVQSAVFDKLSKQVQSVGFNGVVQVSDLLAAAHEVPGVDAVRFLTSADNATNYAIQRVNSLGTVLQTYNNGGTPNRAVDALFGDAEVPVLNSVTLVQRAQNNFGAT